jgi:membrane-associated protease RseP (regulator of RpoE activity)
MIATLIPRARWKASYWSPMRRLRPSATLFTLLIVLPALALSQSPFDSGFTAMQTLFTGTVAKVASLIAIVVGGYQFVHGEPGAKKTAYLASRFLSRYSARRASSRAALSATYLADETPFGKRWIFQDVHSGGAASNAGIEPGDILLSVDGREITPPEHPVFAMGKQTGPDIVARDDQIRLVAVDEARPKEKKLHFVEPTLVEARHLENGLGY